MDSSRRDGSRAHQSRGNRRRARTWSKASPPDILYHATTRGRAERAQARGVLEIGGGRPVYFSRCESQAWRVAHRQPGHPAVLYVDAARAQQMRRCHFERNPRGLWQANSVPVDHVLNLHPDFAEQASAGGIPIFYGPHGPELLMISVERRHRCTWEVAKGKLEPGESPEATAVREVCEEIGIPAELRIFHWLGFIRYGFTTPDRQPRLKTLHMFLMATQQRYTEFAPADSEGIRDARWFTPGDASRAVSHRSLRPLMRRVVGILSREEFDLPVPFGPPGQSTGT